MPAREAPCLSICTNGLRVRCGRGSPPDGARRDDVKLLCEVRNFHVVACLDDLAGIRLQLPCDDLQLRRLARPVDT